MYQQVNPENILFIDIETVPLYPDYSAVPDTWKALWNKKADTLKRNEQETAESLYARAGIYAEFGKIICISLGFLSWTDGVQHLRMKSFSGDDEKQLLTDFAGLLRKHYSRPEHRLCGHNIKEFDIPFIARRMIINTVQLPPMLDIAGKNPGKFHTWIRWNCGSSVITKAILRSYSLPPHWEFLLPKTI